ncbi:MULTISPECIES: class F sortase [unclassified Streptomyces]|uniref:class F sortase n=1 Tax=unclassified Streptomyces TaxID=2593676 RepID=UPI001CA5FFE5|nr:MULTISPECIES: class F sortase [unclassified Streptomyces]MBY8846050.1 class F sortase [Streptomyces sp. SP2-10]
MAADPSSAPAGSARGGRLTLWGVAAVFLAVSLFGGHHQPDDEPQTHRASGAGAGTSADPREPAGGALPRSAPIRLRIPEIAVDAPFTTLTIGASGQLEPPPAGDTNLVGWYADGVSPGEKGTAIIAGHVDTVTSAAVFANLDRLEPGDRFSVERSDGSTADFVVDDADTFAKDDFPSERVYEDASRPEVRLITCAGDYDRTVRDYTDNLVVFAHLV